jgi:hypothetical protein
MPMGVGQRRILKPEASVGEKLVMVLRGLVGKARRASKAVGAERSRINETATVVFHGDFPSAAHLIAATSLHRTFPTVPPERLREAANVLVDAMSTPDEEINVQRLDSAAITVADLFAPE